MAVTGWGEALAGFEAFLLNEEQLQPSTAEGYLLHVGWCAAAVGGDPWRVRAGQLVDWLDSRNWSATTRRLVVVSLRRFYGWGVANGWCRWSPTAALATEGRRPGPERTRLPAGWAGPVGDFLTWLQAAGRSPGTLKLRRHGLARLAECSADPWQVTAEDLTLWLSRPGLSGETRKAMRSSVRMFYGWAVRTGRTDVDPARHLATVRIPRSLPRPAPEETVLGAVVDADDRTRLALLLGALAGLRRAEIAAVHLGRDLAGGVLTVRGKGGHVRVVPVHPDLAAELAAEQERRRAGGHGTGFGCPWAPDTYAPDPTGWLFPSPAKPGEHLSPFTIGSLVADALPPGWSTHSLRHRFGTAAYRAERDLLAVQQLLGQADPKTTAGYAQVAGDALHRTVAAVGLHPTR